MVPQMLETGLCALVNYGEVIQSQGQEYQAIWSHVRIRFLNRGDKNGNQGLES